MIVNGYDLTKIDQPFGELPQEVQWTLIGAFNHGQAIEQCCGLGGYVTTLRPAFSAVMKYRLKPEPVTEIFEGECFCSYHRTCTPTFSYTHTEWQRGKETATVVDGKLTKYVWEADNA